VNNSKVVVIIQARMGSTRLPGKVLKKILDKPMLQYVVDQVSYANLVDELVVATTINPKDDEIVEFCKNSGVKCFRGSENNVLARYYYAAKEFKANCVVRICSDSPLVDPFVIDKIVEIFLKNKGRYDYVSNTLDQTYPLGMNVEVFSQLSLEKSFLNSCKDYEKEHVTPYMYTNPKFFNIYKEQLSEKLNHLRLTVDESQDFSLVEFIIKKLYCNDKPIYIKDISELYKKNKDVFSINSNINQKKIDYSLTVKQ